VSGQNRTFWVASGGIFLANALYSLLQGYWLPGLLQVATAGMAAIAAACSPRLGGDTDSSRPAVRAPTDESEVSPDGRA
jgi:hypothetical protein